MEIIYIYSACNEYFCVDVRSHVEKGVDAYRSSGMVPISQSTSAATSTTRVWKETASMNGKLLNEISKYNAIIYFLLRLSR